jgi:2'-phosphotransferase
MSDRPLTAKETVTLSKTLSKVLRHNALKMGFKMGSDGRVLVDDLLRHQMFRGYTVGNIRDVVDGNDKKRFELSENEDGTLLIRASQGHTIDSIADSELLTEILDASEVPICIHGTYKAFLPLILENGLNKMKRNHIHMAVGLPGADEVISGMRKSCEVVLYINVAAAMAAGVKFYRSSNGVILTAGVENSGVLPAEFIQEVVERSK